MLIENLLYSATVLVPLDANFPVSFSSHHISCMFCYQDDADTFKYKDCRSDSPTENSYIHR